MAITGAPIDGLGAMVGAWRCDEEAKEQAVPMGQLPLMNEIAHYNEVDCKVMMEIVCYLRASHFLFACSGCLAFAEL